MYIIVYIYMLVVKQHSKYVPILSITWYLRYAHPSRKRNPQCTTGLSRNEGSQFMAFHREHSLLRKTIGIVAGSAIGIQSRSLQQHGHWISLDIMTKPRPNGTAS
jgi:hypothetical protein